MIIRKAKLTDIDKLLELLSEVHNLHATARPDIFKKGMTKYQKEDLLNIIECETTPIYVAFEKKQVVGYIFCIIEEIKDHKSLADIKRLYIDDLCIDQSFRHKHIGSALYNHVRMVAKSLKCDHITLNVWNFNEEALRFYEHLGLKPLKTTMEEKL